MGLCCSCRKNKVPFRDKNKIINYEVNGYPTLVSPAIQSSTPKGTPRMSNSFPNMNITNPIKGLVSKRRNRYKKDGFNLDLTYITDNVIAMGYPASNIEGVYRNHIDDVVKFLESKHKDHYFIYNLCSERSYDSSKFQNRVRTFPLDDHNPPKIELIRPFCECVHSWLSKDSRNVAAVHCKAGKGRTGTMICCYLLHSGQFANAEEALNFYGQTRTQDRKGVTIPSQLRYVNYYASLLREGLKYEPVSLYIHEIVLEPTPCFPGGQGYLYFSISQQTIANEKNKEHSQKCVKLFKSNVHEVRKGASNVVIELDRCMPITGDVKLEFYNKPKLGRKEKIFQFWFNTFFVRKEVLTPQNTATSPSEPNGHLPENGNGMNRNAFKKTLVLSLMKNELDIVNKKDKQNKVFSSQFKVTIIMHKVPTKNPGPPSWLVTPTFNQETRQDNTPSESSEADTSEDESNDEDDWDSVLEGEDVDPRGIGYRLLSECDIASQLANTSSEQQELLIA